MLIQKSLITMTNEDCQSVAGQPVTRQIKKRTGKHSTTQVLEQSSQRHQLTGLGMEKAGIAVASPLGNFYSLVRWCVYKRGDHLWGPIVHGVLTVSSKPSPFETEVFEMHIFSQIGNCVSQPW